MSDREPPSHQGAEERIDVTELSKLTDRPPPPKGERAIRVARGVSVLLLAIAAAGLPWYFVTRGGAKGVPTRPPTSSPTRPTPTASPSLKAGSYEVYNVGTVCLNIRGEPSTTSKPIDCLTAGFRVMSDGHTQVAEGRLWRRVYDKLKKSWGWAADQYLKPVA